MQQNIVVYKASKDGFFPEPAKVPTMYFIGVTTGKSSIMKVFPAWANALGLGDAIIRGIDIGIHEDPQVYREVVNFIKNDPLSYGALVTTHKLDLYNACKDMFDVEGPYTKQFHEVSSIYKDGDKLCCEAKDPITCGMAMEEFVPANYWKEHPEAGVMIMGAGGSCISMCSYYMRNFGKGNSPKNIIVANRSTPRLDECHRINDEFYPNTIKAEYFLTPEPGQNDEVLKKMGKGSLIINATGLGKDRPGSPLTDKAEFPEDALVWEINYRGDLLFKAQAEAQQAKKNLKVIDGWMYFIYGWTQVICDVFHMPIQGETLKMCSVIASAKNFNGVLFDYVKGFTVPFSPLTGLSKEAFSTKRYLSQMKGMFSDEKAYEDELAKGDKLIYEFYEMGAPEVPGALAMGTSILYPGKVGDEYNFTKGHFHCILDTAEIYYGLSGEGYMLLESPEGDFSFQPIRPGVAMYVPPRYAHRSINTGKTPMVTFFVFRADAGHDYGTIETKGYRKLLVEKNGIPTVIDNPNWK